ncbi:MAG: MFS transporter [Gammaproteobacteria bacterium]|nr:MFS transporter [Gammaproteobacteria bacterium]NIR85652.1 MFS transporter [Gammaproteobacteria bacterium]NIR90140.1 MFS transporter [Gammaproteobacteria bacterium]NIU06786.1 MFS transporter [Gammaproteobacteria bacterium]NIV53719.1 MFS transporter [Gammaproteobacteria bacterium]
MQAATARFAVLNLGHFYTHLFLLLHPTAVLAMQRELGGAYGDLLLPSTAAFVAFGAGTLPAGWLGDRWPRERLLVALFLGLALGAGLAATASGPGMLTLGLALIGLSASIYHPVGIAMVVEGREQVGRALGINGVFGNLGVAAAPLVAGGLAAAFGWRGAFAAPALVAALTGLLYAALLGCVARPDHTAPVSAHTSAPRPLGPRDRRRLVLVLGTAAFCGGLVFHGTTVVLPKLLEARLGSALGGLLGVGALATTILAGAAFAQIGVGHLIDRRPIRAVLCALAAAQAVLLLAVGFGAGPALALLALAAMAAVFGEIPIHDTLVAHHAASAWRARLYAVKYVLSLGVSALAVPMVAGLHHRGGFPVLFAIFATLAAVVAVAAPWLPQPRAAMASAR